MIPIQSMLNSRKFGVLDQVCTLHAKTLNHTKYYIKTALSTSTISYKSTEERKIYGQGQGAGLSGTSWTFISVPLMITLDKSCIEKIYNCFCRWQNILCKQFESKQTKFNQWTTRKCSKQLKWTTHHHRRWTRTNQMFAWYISLEFSKDWTVTTKEIFDDTEIKVQQLNTNEASLIPGLSTNDKVTYLGITLSRNGNPQH